MAYLQRYLFISLVVFILSGCETIAYYGQAAKGHYQLISQRKPIDDFLNNPDTATPLRNRLQLVKQVRTFASTQLLLPDNQSYLSYVDLKRDSVVWNLYASDPLAFKAVQSCFPIVGCLSYRGYFNQQTAIDKAQVLAKQGYDTYVGPVIAYSTLGWFDDPMINTIIYSADYRIAGLIFHELAHQQLYIDDDTAFNEAFARTVENEGIRRWLAIQKNPALIQQYQLSQQRSEDFSALVLNYRNQLDAMYKSDASEDEKRQHKQALFQALKDSYQTMKQTKWQGYTGYDAWFARDLNNAHLLNVVLYEDYVPAFMQLLADQNNDLQAFYQAAKQLGDKEKAERNQILQQLKQRYLLQQSALQRSTD